ncbi:hypothetical protein C7974DRAFT_52714 [Boeremia exigua]|uniref:uncharacterized protein n=1 Tax=Boeremia exigua TaxID=749465 RepID=UPI001E8DF45D|nr:uncharacterized protein C7974DRAFT_52714 [Boeremia exigua]KAH6616811.1 hypothetical protein C7974DRAFT_52714 [Boeremia exigua]
MNHAASTTSFAASNYFPSRRRVWQACTNCRNRKTRCDAAQPRCGLCTAQDVECIYKDSQQPRIEHNTKILLERIQMLEDRIFSSTAFLSEQRDRTGPPPVEPINPLPLKERNSAWATFSSAPRNGPDEVAQTAASRDAPDGDSQIPIPLSHTANANHVLGWPFVQRLLADSGVLPARPRIDVPWTAATDSFFVISPDSSGTPPQSWRLFHDQGRQGQTENPDHLRNCINSYFEQVDVFFSLLSLSELASVLEAVISSELGPDEWPSDRIVSTAEYCLLLLVLCLGSFVSRGEARIHLESDLPLDDDGGQSQTLDDQLWQKAKLLLGYLSSQVSVEAAQCIMLASLYMGARGRVADSFNWAHGAAVKCEALAKLLSNQSSQPDAFPESFRRLYWVAYIYESDFVSEVSITLPSGITRYEDLVPYPANGQLTKLSHMGTTPGSDGSTPGSMSFDRTDERVAFQISTNAAIRRFLNRANNFVYDSKDQFRMTRANYANWLLRITEDLWSYHGAIYQNLHDFLLKSQFLPTHLRNASSPKPPGISWLPELGHDPWNVLRLEGRYYAGQYTIHRPFIEYVLLNMDHFQTHPCREAILERCRRCLQGCRGFIKVFDVESANSVTCLFAPGMVTFTMIIILRIATLCQLFRDLLSDDVEHVIFVGKRNLRRFARSVKDFQWHLEVLDKLDAACRGMAMS